MTPKQRNAIGKQLLKLQAERAKRRSVQRVVGRRRTDMEVTKARLRVAVETLEQIATLPRGGLAKRLASATLHFIAPEAPKPYPKAICPACGKLVCLYKHGFRSHRHKREWMGNTTGTAGQVTIRSSVTDTASTPSARKTGQAALSVAW